MKFFSLPLYIVVLLLTNQRALGGWTQVGNFQNPQDPVDCGFFFDADHGMIGTGIRDDGDNATIYLTSDGGNSWQQAQTPAFVRSSAVTNIYMQSALIGYASIFSESQILWKTTDGGNTWFDISPLEGTEATCVYATASALILTQWGSTGGVSTDGGATFSQIFTYGNARMQEPTDPSNGIDFSDALHGVVTIGPQDRGPKNYYTADGGITWQTSANLPESWGVYGLKGTNTFFAAGEGDENIPRTLYRSADAGATWQTIYDFTNFNLVLTGGIAGKSNTIYVQTSYDDINGFLGQGLYRSDDLGITWKNVGGPTNSRDTRFVVTGCVGEVVYAFDDQGAVFKTTDGGDGTLQSSASQEALKVSPDTLNLFTSYCSPFTGKFAVTNLTCTDSKLDSAKFVGDTSGVFSSTSIRPATILSGQGDSISVTFVPAHDGRDTAKLVLYGHQGNNPISQTVLLAVDNNTSPQPEISAIASARAGDTALIPIYLKPTEDIFSFTSYSLQFGCNQDVMTPTVIDTMNTLSKNVVSMSMSQAGPDKTTILMTLKQPITETSDLSMPLIYVKAFVTLSDSTETNVTLNSFAIDGESPLALCAFPSQLFQIQQECGDSIISYYMKGKSVAGFLSVQPNPSHQNSITASYTLSKESEVGIEAMNARGEQVAIPLPNEVEKAGNHLATISTEGWPSGNYYLVLRTADGGVSVVKLVEVR